jgi:hypothetical protein
MSAPDGVHGRRTGMVVTGVVTAFLLFDATIHVLNIEVVKTSMAELGYPARLNPAIGVIELCCIALYVARRTSALGAVLLTGFLGGAIATNLRVDQPLFSTTLFPFYVAVAMWFGLYLRNVDIRRVVHKLVHGHAPDQGDTHRAQHTFGARASRPM